MKQWLNSIQNFVYLMKLNEEQFTDFFIYLIFHIISFIYSILFSIFKLSNSNFRIRGVFRKWREFFNFSGLESPIVKFFFIMLIYMPLKYDKSFGCIHCLLCLWQPLRLDVFLWARRFSFVKRNGSKNLYQILRKKLNKV